MAVMAPDSLFKALADASRRRILQVLLRAELSVSELVTVLGLPQSTVSRHLKALRDAGLVDARYSGTSATYFPLRNQNGAEDGLREQLVGWSARQALPRLLKTRLEKVQRTRRSQSDVYFARVSHRWDQMRIDCFGPAFHLEALTALLPREWVVADVGTGTGYLLPLLGRQFARVIAVDPVEEMLNTARQRVEAAGLSNVEFRPGSATALPIEDSSLDLCIASLVLHHDPAPAEALMAINKALKPSGRILIVEQRSHTLAAFHELMQDRWWGFEPGDLAEQLRAAGFEGVAIHGLTSVEPASHSSPEAPDLFVLTGRKR